MPRITISYRREDSGAITGRIFDRLVAHYGRDAVFRDIDNIPLGVDFRQHIGDALGASNVVLAIVGPRWTGARETGNRLDDEADPVRLEIEATLRKAVPLIPVLVLGATMPQTRDLPDSLKDFAYRNAIQIDAGQDFDVHIARLIRAMDEMLHLSPRPAAIADPPKDQPRRRGFGVTARLALTLGILAAIGIPSAGWYFGTRSIPALQGTGSTPKTEAPPVASPSPASPTKPPAPPPVDAEAVFWQSIAASDNAADFNEYLGKYPNGRFAGLARNRLAALAPPAPPAPAPSAMAQPSFDCAKAQSPEEIIICGRPDLAAADGELGKLYWSLYNAASGADAARLKADETAWVQTRNAECNPTSRGGSVDRAAMGDCLLREINTRIAYLRNQSATAAAPAAAPLVPGSATICGRSVNYTISNSTSPQYATYLGVWTGVWNNASRICGAIIVEEVNPGGVADITYIYGPSNAVNPFPWREQRVIGRFDGTSRFSFQDDEGGRFAFSLAGNRTLDAVFSGQSGSLHAQFAKSN